MQKNIFNDTKKIGNKPHKHFSSNQKLLINFMLFFMSAMNIQAECSILGLKYCNGQWNAFDTAQTGENAAFIKLISSIICPRNVLIEEQMVTNSAREIINTNNSIENRQATSQIKKIIEHNENNQANEIITTPIKSDDDTHTPETEPQSLNVNSSDKDSINASPSTKPLFNENDPQSSDENNKSASSPPSSNKNAGESTKDINNNNSSQSSSNQELEKIRLNFMAILNKGVNTSSKNTNIETNCKDLLNRLQTISGTAEDKNELMEDISIFYALKIYYQAKLQLTESEQPRELTELERSRKLTAKERIQHLRNLAKIYENITPNNKQLFKNICLWFLPDNLDAPTLQGIQNIDLTQINPESNKTLVERIEKIESHNKMADSIKDMFIVYALLSEIFEQNWENDVYVQFYLYNLQLKTQGANNQWQVNDIFQKNKESSLENSIKARKEEIKTFNTEKEALNNKQKTNIEKLQLITAIIANTKLFQITQKYRIKTNKSNASSPSSK